MELFVMFYGFFMIGFLLGVVFWLAVATVYRMLKSWHTAYFLIK